MKTVTVHQYPPSSTPLVFENVTSYEPTYLGEFSHLLIKGVERNSKPETPYETYIPLGNVIQIDSVG